MMRNTVKKILCVAAAAVAAANVFAGCSGEKPSGGGDKTQTQETLVSRICTLDSGKTYLEVDGKPFAIRGVQIRTDALVNRAPDFENALPAATYEELDGYFAAAAELGFNTVEIPLEWRRVETADGEYDFSHADKLLGMCNKYRLKCEFLWFSTNMCGYSYMFNIPEYIWSDEEKYPSLDDGGDQNNTYIKQWDTVWDYAFGGHKWLVLNNENLMRREKLVMEKLMAHVAEWNIANGEKNPLIGMQIHNEADGRLRWKLDQYGLKLDGEKVGYEDIWEMTLDALDNAGRAVKSSDYKIYTRCNITTSYGAGEFAECAGTGFSPKDILALDGIDAVGDDPYLTTPKSVNDDVKGYSVSGNYPHIAENMGDYESSPSLFLAAYRAGGCYMFYELATSPYWIQIRDRVGLEYRMDQGLLNADLSYKAHTAQTKSIIGGIAAMGSVLPLIESSDFACFNIMTEKPANTFSQTVNTSSLSFTYETQNGGIAYAIERDGYAYLYATADCKITVNNAEYTLKADIGAFDKDVFEVAESKVINPDGIRLEANKLHRIKIRKINENVTSTADANV